MKKVKGFIVHDEITGKELTDRSGKVLLFVDYKKYVEYVQKNRLNVFHLRGRLACKRFTRRYSVI